MSEHDVDRRDVPELFSGYEQAMALKRERQLALAQALCGPSQPEPETTELDALADAVAEKLLSRVTEAEPEPDVITGAALHAQEREGRVQPRAHWPHPSAVTQPRVPATGFDGGARQSFAPKPPTHEETLAQVVRERLADRGAAF